MVIKVAGGHNCWLQSPSACGDTLTVWIRNWAGASATGGTQIQLQAPAIKEVGGSKSFPASSAAFGSSQLYALVRNPATANCVRCHSSTSATQQQPFFADADVDVAYAAIKSKINLDNTDQSRLVVRLRDEFHNCWGSAGCAANAQTMLDAVNAFADAIPVTNVDPDLLISKGLTLYDGTVAAGGNRYEADTIAKYEFKTGMGNIAYDTSGLEPALNLTLSGDVTWVGGWGLNVKMGGKAQGTVGRLEEAHRPHQVDGRIHHRGVGQQCQRRAGRRVHRQLLGGRQLRATSRWRRTCTSTRPTRAAIETGANGNPILITRRGRRGRAGGAAARRLTYSPVEGRRIYVNGVFTGDMDAAGWRLARRLGRHVRAGARQRDLDEPPVGRRVAHGRDPQPRADARRRSSRTSTPASARSTSCCSASAT